MPIADIDYREYFTGDKIEELTQAFAKYDTTGSGALSESELHVMFKKMGRSLTRQQVREVMGEVDLDSSGDVDFEELCVLEIKMSRIRPRADLIDHREYLDDKTIRELEMLFVQHDPFGGGSIGITELQRIIEILGSTAPQEEIEEIRAELDKDDSGEIEFEDLCAFWAVLTKRRKRINYREFLSTEQVTSFRKKFQMFDSRGRGRVSRGELDQLLRHLGVSLRKAQLNGLMRDFDPEGSGDVDFESFAVMMLRLKGLQRRRCINPETCSCEELWNQESFSIRELQQSGFGLEDFRRVGIPVGKIYKEGRVTALDLRRAGYTAMELRRAGVGVSELRTCGFSGADLRNAGFSDRALLETNRALKASFSTGDLSMLPQQRPGPKLEPTAQKGRSPSITGGIPLTRQMTLMIREHTDWRPQLSRSRSRILVPVEPVC